MTSTTMQSLGSLHEIDPKPVLFDFPHVCLNATDPSPPDPSRLHYGSILILACVSAITFATIIAWRYNHVLVIHRKIRFRTVSNTNWIVYFVVAGIANGLHLCRIVSWDKRMEQLDFILFYIQLFTTGMSSILLCLALDYQRRHRSHNPPTVPTGFSIRSKNDQQDIRFPLLHSVNAVATFTSKNEFNHRCWNGTMVIVMQSAIYCGLLVVDIILNYCGKNSKLSDTLLKWLLLASIWLIQVTLLVIAVIIISNRDEDGPVHRSKMFLGFATVLSVICHALPTCVWQKIFPHDCLWNVLAWTDLLDLVTFVSYILYYLFMRDEYQRTKEACIYSTVSQVQQAQLHHHTWRQP